MNDILDVLKSDIEKAVAHLKVEFSQLQVGRASAGLVDGLMVESYGTKQPLKAVANVSVPDAKTVQIQPWDKGQLVDIEKAISSSDLNVTPMNDGISIRINIPPLTEERRKDLTKVVNKMAEEERITVRQYRQKAFDKIKVLDKDKEITEDDVRSLEKKVQEIIDNANKIVEDMAKSKENDVLTV